MLELDRTYEILHSDGLRERHTLKDYLETNLTQRLLMAKYLRKTTVMTLLISPDGKLVVNGVFTNYEIASTLTPVEGETT